MTITVSYSNSNKDPISIADQTIDHSTSLYLVGRNATGFSNPIAGNFLHLLENFANSTPPSNPIEGQLWYDTTYPTNKILKIYNGASWVPATGVYQQTNDPSTEPNQNLKAGDIWVDSATSQLKIWNGSSWIVVGPSIPSNGKNGTYSETWNDSLTGPHSVIVSYIDDEAISVVSKDSFTPNPVRAGFTNLVPGLNVSTKSFNNVTAKISGLADVAQSLKLTGYVDPVPADNFLRTDVNGAIINGFININNDAGIKIGAVTRTVFLERDSQNVAILSNRVNGGSIGLSVIKDGVLNQILTVEGNHKRVGINKKSPVVELDVVGSISASGKLAVNSVASDSALIGGGALIAGSTIINGSLRVGTTATIVGKLTVGATTGNGSAIEPITSGNWDLGSSAKPFNVVYANNFSNSSTTYSMIATGMIITYAGLTTPDGWLVCDGTAYDTEQYSRLFSVTGSSNLPDLTGVSLAPGLSYIIKY